HSCPSSTPPPSPSPTPPLHDALPISPLIFSRRMHKYLAGPRRNQGVTTVEQQRGIVGRRVSPGFINFAIPALSAVPGGKYQVVITHNQPHLAFAKRNIHQRRALVLFSGNMDRLPVPTPVGGLQNDTVVPYSPAPLFRCKLNRCQRMLNAGTDRMPVRCIVIRKPDNTLFTHRKNAFTAVCQPHKHPLRGPCLLGIRKARGLIPNNSERNGEQQ